jgi:glycosyltransferase involved in cell wall biosynthesis
MKIGFISDTIYPYFKGGLEMLRHAEITELAKSHEVYSFSMRFDGMAPEFRTDGINYVTFGETRQDRFYRHGRRSIRNALKYAFLLPFYLFRYDLDVVQVNAFPYLHLPIVRFYCSMKGCKMIVAEYEVWTEQYWRDYLGPLGFLATPVNVFEKWSLRLGDYFTACSSDTCEKMVSEHIQRDEITIIYPVIEDAVIAAGKRPGNKRKKQMIFAGRLIKEKRLDLWIETFAKARKSVKDLKGLIIGEGPESGEIASMIKRKGLSSSVKLRPFFKEKKELYKEIASSSVLLNMSEREGLSIISLEGIALGTPVVLPSYSPIPNEVSSMCIVDSKEMLPSRIAAIIKGKGGKRNIDLSKLGPFLISTTNKTYSQIFEKLGLKPN